MKNLICSILIMFLGISAFSQGTYYVSASGGTGAGTSPGTSWSFGKYNSTASTIAAGSTILFNKGDVFAGVLQIPKQGTQSARIRIGSYGTGAKPTIKAGATLTGWSNAGTGNANIWFAPLTYSFGMVNSLIYDGINEPMGRYPNGASNYLTYTGSNATSSVQATQISGTALGSLPGSAIGAEVVIRKYRWVLDRHLVTAQSGNTLTFANDGRYGANGAYNVINGNGCFIQSALWTLDQNGEWYFDNANNRMYLYSTTNPSTHTIMASNTQFVANFLNGSNITVDSLKFVSGDVAMYMNTTSNVNINYCDFTQLGADAIDAVNSDHINVVGCTFTDLNDTGVWFGEGSTFITVTQCKFNGIGMIPGSGLSGDAGYQGIRMLADNTVMTYNEFRNIGYSGIYHIGTAMLIQYNFIDGFASVKDDGGGIYTVNSAGILNTNGMNITDNIVLNGIGAVPGTAGDPNNNPNGQANGIYLDDNSNNAIVNRNYVNGMSGAGIFLHRAYNTTVTGNTTFNAGQGFLSVDEAGQTRNLVIKNNYFIAKTANQLTMEIDIFNTNDVPSIYATAQNWDNNYYARPIAEGNTIFVRTSSGTTFYSLANWKSIYGKDATSSVSKITITDIADFRTDYNTSLTNQTLSFTTIYKDVTNTSFNGSKMLTSYSGWVGANTNAIATGGTGNGGGNTGGDPPVRSPVFVTPGGKVIITPNNKVVAPVSGG